MLNRSAAFLALLLLVVSGCSDQPSPVGKPSTPPSEAPPPVSDEPFGELSETLAQVPGWAITDSDPTIILRKCGGDWSSRAGGWSAGTIPPGAWADETVFRSAAQASDATALLVENLTSCTADIWRTQPIAQTGAVLASSATGVAWIHQKGATVSRLQMSTTDGPPPLAVQVEVAEMMAAHINSN